MQRLPSAVCKSSSSLYVLQQLSAASSLETAAPVKSRLRHSSKVEELAGRLHDNKSCHAHRKLDLQVGRSENLFAGLAIATALTFACNAERLQTLMDTACVVMKTHKVSSLNCHRLGSLVLNAELSLQYVRVFYRSVLPRESARLTVPKCPGFGPARNVLIKIESSEVLRSATHGSFCGVDGNASDLSPRQCDKLRRRTPAPT